MPVDVGPALVRCLRIVGTEGLGASAEGRSGSARSCLGRSVRNGIQAQVMSLPEGVERDVTACAAGVDSTVAPIGAAS